MARHRVTASKSIPAPAQEVYALIADYQNGHARMLPKPYFVSLTVEQSGIGAGTVINFQMRLMGQLQTFRSAITEPEPGRVLAETVLATGAVTTFTVEPQENGQSSQVTIATETTVRDGLLGKLEGFFTTQLLQPIYVKELAQLAAIFAR